MAFVHCPNCKKIVGNAGPSDDEHTSKVLRDHAPQCRGPMERLDALELENVALKENVAQLHARLDRLEQHYGGHRHKGRPRPDIGPNVSDVDGELVTPAFEP